MGQGCLMAVATPTPPRPPPPNQTASTDRDLEQPHNSANGQWERQSIIGGSLSSLIINDSDRRRLKTERRAFDNRLKTCAVPVCELDNHSSDQGGGGENMKEWKAAVELRSGWKWRKWDWRHCHHYDSGPLICQYIKASEIAGLLTRVSGWVGNRMRRASRSIAYICGRLRMFVCSLFD